MDCQKIIMEPFIKYFTTNMVFYIYKSEPVGANKFTAPYNFSVKVYFGSPKTIALISATKSIIPSHLSITKENYGKSLGTVGLIVPLRSFPHSPEKHF